MSDSLTQPSGYDPKQMVFSKPSTNTIPTKKGPPITYQRINITTKGKKELIFPTPNHVLLCGVFLFTRPGVKISDDNSMTQPRVRSSPMISTISSTVIAF